MRRVLTLCLALAAAGCAETPGFTGEMSARARAADYMPILPLGQLQTRIAPPLPAAFETSVAARAAGLRARAARLRAPVIDAGTRARMAAALARH